MCSIGILRIDFLAEAWNYTFEWVTGRDEKGEWVTGRDEKGEAWCFLCRSLNLELLWGVGGGAAHTWEELFWMLFQRKFRSLGSSSPSSSVLSSTQRLTFQHGFSFAFFCSYQLFWKQTSNLQGHLVDLPQPDLVLTWIISSPVRSRETLPWFPASFRGILYRNYLSTHITSAKPSLKEKS